MDLIVVILKGAVELGKWRDYRGSAGVLSTHVDEQNKMETETRRKDQADFVSYDQGKTVGKFDLSANCPSRPADHRREKPGSTKHQILFSVTYPLTSPSLP